MKPAHEIIKELRLKNGMSQKALAEEIGMTQQSVALLENGKRKVEFDLFIKIMDVLKEPLLDLLCNYRMEKELDDKLQKIVFSNLDDAFVAIIEAYGGYVYFDDDDFTIFKYQGKTSKLTDIEDFNLKNSFGRIMSIFLRCVVDEALQDLDKILDFGDFLENKRKPFLQKHTEPNDEE